MLTIIREELAGIPSFILRDTRVDEGPVVIHYHGWTGDKGSIENPDQSLVQLASAGFCVVARTVMNMVNEGPTPGFAHSSMGGRLCARRWTGRGRRGRRFLRRL